MRLRRVVASIAALTLGAAILVLGTANRPVTAGAESPVVVAATGDLGSSVSEIKPVADLMKSWSPDRYLLLGDLVYPDGQASGFSGFFDQVYGPVKNKIVPVPGNHDFHSSSGAPYFAYFPDSLPRLVPLGNGWAVITINTEVSHGAGSAQELAVKALVAQAKAEGLHIIAITHHPRYTACDSHGDDSALSAIVADLEAAGADLFLAGHNHCYERFKIQPGNGIRFFTVGTGGNGLYACESDARHAYCDGDHHGALRLELYSDHYDWRFVTTSGLSEDEGTSPTRSGGTTTTTTQPTSTTTQPTTTSTTNPPTTTTTVPNPPVCKNQGVYTGRAKWVHVIYGDCIDGGIVWINGTPYTASWSTFHSTGGWVIRGPATVKNTIVVNIGDSYHVEKGGAGFHLSHVAGVYGHDDAIENDQHNSGVITDSYFSSYVGYSDSGENSTNGNANTVLINRTHLELLPVPGVYKGPSPGTGPLFKMDANAAALVLTDNTFVMHQAPNHGTLGPPSVLKSCSGNTIEWTGPGAFPARAAWLAACPDTRIIEGA